MMNKLFLTLILLLCSPAWGAFRSSAQGSGVSAFPSSPVPAGVAVDDIVILFATIDGSAQTYEAADWPTGFTELCEVVNTLDGQVTAVGWKRLTAADSGNYTFGDITNLGGTAGNWLAHALAFSGRHTSSPPVATFCNDTNNSANTSVVTITASSITAEAGDDLFTGSAPDVNTTDVGAGHTPPSGFTEQQDTENLFSNLASATQDNVSAGATGAVSWLFTMTGGTSAWTTFLIRIPTNVVEGPPPPNAQDGSRLHLVKGRK